MDLKILEMMRFKPTGHNQVSLDHIECVAEFLEEFCPIDKTKAKRMLRGSMGISMRYIQEYLDSFEAWKIIKVKSGTIEYLLKEDNKIVISDMKNEDVLDTFPGNTGVLPDCRLRPLDPLVQCNPSTGIYISYKKQMEYCNTCEQRLI